EPQDLCKNPRALPHFLPPIPLQKSMDGLRMVRSRVGQRILNQPARHGARSSGSRGGPESDRRAGLAWRRGHHAAPTFDEERQIRIAAREASMALITTRWIAATTGTPAFTMSATAQA